VPEKLQELTASIKEKGILQPIVARKVGKDHFEIIAGERRWRAAQAAGLERVPVILKEVQNQESLELALIENLQRHDLNPIDEAEAYQRLADEFDLTQQEIAQKVGKDRVTVANAVRLLSLTPEVKLMLAQGELSAGHAKALLALTDPAKQKELAKKITSEKLTVRAAEKLVQGATRKALNTTNGLEFDVAGKLVKGLESDLAKTLGTKVEIAYNKGNGTIAIKYYSDEDLTRIIEQIKR
jgi:ParB family chromosome partitioning protein